MWQGSLLILCLRGVSQGSNPPHSNMWDVVKGCSNMTLCPSHTATGGISSSYGRQLKER